MRAWCAGLALAAIFSLPRTSPAQQISAQDAAGSLRVVVRSADGSPAQGALVAIVDRQGQLVAEALTNSIGERSFSIAQGSYRARILRIGYLPTWSDWKSVSGETRLDIALNEARVNLNTLVVRTRSACARMDQDPQGTGLVWAEIIKALRSSQLTISDSDSLARARIYKKVADEAGWIISSDTTWVPIRDRQPFSAVEPASLARNGYVRGTLLDGFEFFGPDEKVLLSNEFAATHCFQLVRDSLKPDAVGVAFHPVPGRRTADIAGTIWVDAKTSELREITFSYVRAGLPRDSDAGGFTRFQRVASGGWIISEWQMRMPRLEIRLIPYRYGSPHREATEVVGRTEFGGGVETRESSSRASETRLSRVTGVAFDSVQLRPMADATIEISGISAITDEAGRFVLDGISPGNHVIKLSHPSLTPLGFAGLEQPVHVAGDSISVALSTPSLKRTWERICRNVEYDESAWRGLVHGLVSNARGEPLGGVVVQFYWQVVPSPTGPAASVKADLRPKKLEVRTDQAGRYSACGFELGAVGTVTVPQARPSMPVMRFSMTASPVVRVDLRPE